MGHPRSGSSLLMHVLSDHNKIIGFGEYFIKYQNFESLIKSEFDIRRKSRQLFKKCEYIVNQVNHRSVTPNRDVIITNSRYFFKFLIIRIFVNKFIFKLKQ